MHRVELLEQLLAQAVSKGYIVRQEWLGGRTGGVCQIGDKRYLFLDLALNVAEQLAQVSEALKAVAEQSQEEDDISQPSGSGRHAA
jgi:hypothetical protein